MNYSFFSPKVVKKDWGEEIWIAHNEADNYSGKILKVKKGHRFSMHAHILKSETFYFLLGSAILRIIDTGSHGADIKEYYLTEGNSFDIPRLVPHQIEALSDLTMIESSTFHRDSDTLRYWR